MKHINKYIAVLAILSLGIFSGCHKVEEEITEMNLYRCLEPLNLTAKVTAGDQVTFGWDLTKGADKYALEVYSDASLSSLVFSYVMPSNEVPYTTKLEADASYYFRVQAQTSLTGKEFSKWVAYDKEIKTYAVKSELFLKVADRTPNSLSFTWNADPEVDRLEYGVVGTDGMASKTLSADEIAAGAAVVDGLEASTNYAVILYFKSANRGEVNVWTRPNVGDAFPVSTVAELTAALAAKEPKILVKASDAPYEMAVLDILAPVEFYGEESVDGTRPVLYGEFSIPETFPGGKIYFESIEMNGKKNEFGFAIQLKNGGKASHLPIESIIYKNCNITGYSKGILYEWGQTMDLGELAYDCCNIYEVNADGSGGGDGIDLRGASSIAKVNIINNTIYTGFRTFLRVDATPVLGDVVIKNNTIMNLAFVDNTNNGGLMGIKSKPSSLLFANNLILYMQGKASVIGVAAANLTASDAGLVCSNNWYYSLPETFFNEKVSQAEAIAGGGKILAADPCYNAKGGSFHLTNPDLVVANVGASKWLTPYIEEPEDLTLEVIENIKVWDFSNAKYFVGDITKSKVRDNILMGVIDNPMKVDGGIMQFLATTAVSKKGVPTDGYMAFKVNRPGSVYILPSNINDISGNHIIISVGNPEGTTNSIKGGAAANVNMGNNQKILINDIAEESIVYVYASGPIGIKNLAWSFDTTQVNTALATPEPEIAPASVTQGTAASAEVSWAPVQNAASYSVVFNGKSYPVEGTSYTISPDVVKFLDAGGYIVSVYANPGDDDIYNTQSSAGKVGFTVLPKGGGGSGETVVNSVEELLNAIASGKIDITLAYNAVPYELGTLALTTPLRLKGQTNGNSYTSVRGNVSISGEIGGSIIFKNLDFDGNGAAGAVIVEGEVTVADTIALIDCNVHDYGKALYDNSKKFASNVQYLIFNGLQVNNSSNGSDMIDMRNGAYHNLIVTKSTFANSARTFIRTDASSEINYALIRNNTFYKLCTNATSKDNNGLFHIRGTAGSGMLDYRIMDNLFYSIKIDAAPEHANGYPKFISKNAAALKPNVLRNNYFYNIEEENADYTWWTVNCSREEGIAGNGCVLSADPCKDAANGDYTLTNAVAMNANVGDPRWNPMGGGSSSSEITVTNVNELLTAISAGKTTITLSAGTYNLNEVTDVAEVAAGVLTLSTSLNLIANFDATFIGGFKMAPGIQKFSANGVLFDGASTIGNMIDVSDAAVSMTAVNLKNCYVDGYKNRLYSQSAEASLTSLDLNGVLVYNMGTSGDFIDIRKGTATAVKVANSTFANGIRTFMRIDAAVACGAITVQNNTFYNLSSVDSKDNNGIFHVRATSITPETFMVKKNLFATMHRAAEAPSNANGFPKIVSSNTAGIIPTFSGNYYYDFDTAEGFNWWNRIDEATGTAGYGIVLTTDPFANAGAQDFTLVNALAISENVGDPRWNPNHGGNPGETFKVTSVDELLTAISAGKTAISLAYGTYDLTTVAPEVTEVAGGVLTLATSLQLSGIAKNGLKPELIGGFKLAGNGVATLAANGIKFTGVSGETTIGNMIDVSDATVDAQSIRLMNCEISQYKNRLYSQSAEAKVGSIDLIGLVVSEMGTGGDCIDVRKGTANLLKVQNCTFYNGVRTFIRMDAAVVCGAVTVSNNTFYNMCFVDSKDNNGILHVRSTALDETTSYVVEKNIFATMHRAVEAPSNANGYPKLVSANTASKIPVFRNNLYYDIDTAEGFSWWNRIDEATGTANGGAVLTETPFAGDPALGKFTVKAAYKGIGDIRW